MISEKEILEGNKLIAKFDHRLNFKNNKKNFAEWIGCINGEIGNAFMSSQLKYHKSWNWIMFIVEKISTINHGSKEGQRYIFNTNRCAKSNINENDKPIKIRIKGVIITYPMPFIEINSFDELEGTWLAVVEFIKFWNKSNK